MRYILSLNVKLHMKKVIVLVVEHLSLHLKQTDSLMLILFPFQILLIF